MSDGSIKCRFVLPPEGERPKEKQISQPKLPRASEIIQKIWGKNKSTRDAERKRKSTQTHLRKGAQEQTGAGNKNKTVYADGNTTKRSQRQLTAASAEGPRVKQRTILEFFDRDMKGDLCQLQGSSESSVPETVMSRICSEDKRDDIWISNPLAIVKSYWKEVQQKIDAGTLVLHGNPWLQPPCPHEVVASQLKQLGKESIDSRHVLQFALQPRLFVWAPAKLGQDIQVLCPNCQQPGKHPEWSQPRVLHGTSKVSFYVTCCYTCDMCGNSQGDARGRKRKKFSADAPAVRSMLPQHISAKYEILDTGRTLCEIDVMDYIRAMATKTSFSAVAESLNEMKATTWTRLVTLAYRRICAEFCLEPLEGWPAMLPREYLLSDQWVRNAYVRDAKQRSQEAHQEFQALVSHEILMVDWTKDAGKRCGARWLFNIMDSGRQILDFKLTCTSKPSEVEDLMGDLALRGIHPKVLYVDDECCGAWRSVVKKVWPGTHVRLDPMHALRRLTQTTSSTNHPEHDEFCSALSQAIYEWDQEVLLRLQAAWLRDGKAAFVPRAEIAKYVPKKIFDAARIVHAIESVLEFYASRKHATHGFLLTPATHQAWKALKQHIVAGCLCDVAGVNLHHATDKQVSVGGEPFTILQSRRGSSALEGFHTHQKQWLGMLAHHSSEAGTFLLTDGALRWNRKRRHGATASTASLVFAGGLLQEVGMTA